MEQLPVMVVALFYLGNALGCLMLKNASVLMCL